MTAIDQSGLYELKNRLLESPNVECLEHGIQLLEEYAAQAYGCELQPAGDGANTLRQLLELAMSCQYDGADESLWRPMTEFSAQHCETLGELFHRASENEDISENLNHVEEFRSACQETWGEYLQLLTSDIEQHGDPTWNEELAHSEEPAEAPAAESEVVSTDQIDQLLSVLNQTQEPLETEAADNQAQEEFDAESETEESEAEESEALFQDATAGVSEPEDEAQSESDVASLLEGILEGSESEVPTANNGELFGESDSSSNDDDWLPADQLDVVASDFEIRDAYLEDAVRCLDQMEKCSLEFEESHDKEETVRLFCRELHTLKGASASVGLTSLASVIHDKETVLQNTNDFTDEELTDLLLDSVDKMRSVIDRIQPGGQTQSEPETDAEQAVTENESLTSNTTIRSTIRPTRPSRPTVNVSSSGSSISNEDPLIRVRTSKLDRLMDMLAELVVLRNRRESHLIDFNECNKELTRCAARLSVCQNTRFNREDDDEQFANALGGQLTEIARDISVVASSIRDFQKPVGNDNLSISHFIRDFRQELMQLRRVPTEGLFNRLQRAARDVAKLEEKQLKLNFIGGETGIEQELQEKLYEPLMHIVRNAVSHGLESAEDRVKVGKPEHGTITLKAQTNSQILVIEISDNGRGLDYDAIRKRGMERGLIKGSDRVSNDELAHLIFHPGFSTRDEATQVSGRGVGMDIVSTTLEQMRGRIDIESEANVGTTMRMIVPLRSSIEHVMVFKASDQLFALPTQAVVSANRSSEFQRNDLVIHPFSDMLSMPSTDCQDIILLRANQQGSGDAESIGLRVQEIIGPEEVVMRNLPGLVNNHPLFSGLTLSGAGDTVLLLDSETLADFATQYQSVTEETTTTTTHSSSARKVVLVVDDSLSARKMLVRKLAALGIDTKEAGDGVEALDVIRQNKFDLILTDLDMPRLGGMELLFDLQKRDRYDTPVVVVTSRSQEQFRQQAMDRGAADYLTKPVTDEALGKVLSQLNIISN